MIYNLEFPFRKSDLHFKVLFKSKFQISMSDLNFYSQFQISLSYVNFKFFISIFNVNLISNENSIQREINILQSYVDYQGVHTLTVSIRLKIFHSPSIHIKDFTKKNFVKLGVDFTFT